MAINPLAIGGGVVAAAAVVGGGLYAGGVFSSGQTQTAETEPKWHYLSQDSNYMKSDKSGVDEAYDNKYGKTYNLFLVGVTNSTVQGAEADNTNWWNWSFKKNYKNATKDKGFATGITSGETLKDACLQAYKGTLKGDGSAVDLNSESGNKSYPVTEIWRFCTPFGKKVQTLKDMGSEETYTASTTYGGVENNKSDLVATKATSNKANEHFWKVKEIELKGAEDSNFTSVTGGTSEFKKLHNKLKGAADNNGSAKPAKPTLRETCADAYAKTKDNGTNYPKEDIGKFCSLSGNALTQLN